MRPAASIIFFTVTAGAGYGLFIVALAAYHTTAMAPGTLLSAGLAALVLVTAGLCASTMHLANPRNAWRAFSQIKTSWLSREGVLALAFYPLALLYLLAAWAGDGERSVPLGLLGAASAAAGIATVLATGMIYACLRTVRRWRTPLTPINYLLLSLMHGALALGCVHAVRGEAVSVGLTAVLFLLGLGFLGKLLYFLVVGAPAGPTIGAATGFDRARVKLLDVGHTAGNFLTHEFGFEVDRRALVAARIAALALACWAPALALISSGPAGGAPVWIGAAAASYAGVLLERWLFFAEAQHVVRLYHGAERA